MKTGMSAAPLVSVITILLNMEKYLQEAVESVFAQTFREWELLLVDDGSTDGSTKLAKSYAERYPDKVHYLEHEGHQNRGMSASRNLGLAYARGELVAFLDADDVWMPEKLEKQIGFFNAYPDAAMVYGPAYFFYDDPGERQPGHLQPLGVRGDALLRPPELFEVFVRDFDITPSPSGAMIRKSVLPAVGGFVEPFRGMYEDQVMWAKIALNYPVYCSSGCLYRYRRHSTACGVAAVGHAQYERDFFRWLNDYIRELPPGTRKRVKGLVLTRLFESILRCAVRRSAGRGGVLGRLRQRVAFAGMMVAEVCRRPRLLSEAGAVRLLSYLVVPSGAFRGR